MANIHCTERGRERGWSRVIQSIELSQRYRHDTENQYKIIISVNILITPPRDKLRRVIGFFRNLNGTINYFTKKLKTMNQTWA
jgi:hypothetical protein